MCVRPQKAGDRRRRVRLRGLAWFAACAAALGCASRQATPSAAPVSAGGWQEHESTLNALGFTTAYSPDVLAAKLKFLLRSAGARQDVDVVPLMGGAGVPNGLASAHVRFFTLNPNATSATSATAAGSWRSVTLAPRPNTMLTAGDCELVEQFEAQLLPLFATRGVVDRVRCSPRGPAASSFVLTFQVFAPS